VAWGWVIVAASLLPRLALLDFESGDYRAFLSGWYDFLVEHGRWHGLGQQFSSYPPLYLYLLSLSTLLPLPKLYAIKGITLASDYVAAWFVWRLARRRFPNGPAASAALALFLFLPTVVMNGALWGQCDVMYTAGFLASLYYVLEGRAVAALVAFGFSCSLKPQAIFWCPLLAGLFLTRRISWRWVWVPVAVYLGCGIPAILAGRPVWRAVAHWALVRDYPGLTHGAVPNWYAWGSSQSPDTAWWAGIVLTLSATGWFLLRMKRGPCPPEDPASWLVAAALLSVMFPPFLLPGMHERYFFAADVLSLVYVFYRPGAWLVAALIQMSSAFAYVPYLFGAEPIPVPCLSTAVLAALVLVAGDFLGFQPNRKPSEGSR
jgi:Gpi18-like mannosyltransferase